MTGSAAAFEVAKIVELAALSAVALRGHVKTGIVASSMLVKV